MAKDFSTRWTGSGMDRPSSPGEYKSVVNHVKKLRKLKKKSNIKGSGNSKRK